MKTIEILLKKKMELYQGEMLFHLKQLLKIESIREEPVGEAPYGKGCKDALEYILKLSEKFGLKTVNLDNHIGYSEYGRGEEYVCSIAHLDVVPPGEGWNYLPFGAEEKNGIIYSRGAGDCKPGNIVGLYTLRCLKELQYIPKRKIRIIYGCAEETGQEDLSYYLKHEPLPVFGITPDSDGYDIIYAEKGRMEIQLTAEKIKDCPLISVTGGTVPNMVAEWVEAVFDKELLSNAELNAILQKAGKEEVHWKEEETKLHLYFQGKSAHAAMPEGSINAISLYSKFYCEILPERADPLTSFLNKYIGLSYKGENLGFQYHDEEMGDFTICMNIIKMEKEKIISIGDIRFPAHINSEAIQKRLQDVMEPLGISFEVICVMESFKVTDSPGFDILRSVCAKKEKPEPRMLSISGSTYAKQFKGRVVAFGGCGECVHAPDEFLSVKEYFEFADIISYTIYKLSKDL